MLYPCDCIAFLRAIPAESIQLVVTSPPFNIGKEYEQSLKIDDYFNQQKEVIEECVRVLHPRGGICWQVGSYVDIGEIIPLTFYSIPASRTTICECEIESSGSLDTAFTAPIAPLAGMKRSAGSRNPTRIAFSLDPVRIPQKYPGKRQFRGPKKGQYPGNPKGKNPSDIRGIPNVKSNHVDKTYHPCQFPIALVQRLAPSLPDEGDWVLDPFPGLGSTVAAAVSNGRKGAGEIGDSDYRLDVQRVGDALDGKLPVRSDKRVYVHPAYLSLAQNPWLADEKDNRCTWPRSHSSPLEESGFSPSTPGAC